IFIHLLGMNGTRRALIPGEGLVVSFTRTSRSSSFPRVDAGSGALLGDGFLPDPTLEEWVRVGSAERSGAVLTLSDGRRFALVDAVRILGRRNGDSDPYGFTGRILTLRALLRRGALLSPDGARLGAAIYDVQFGSIAEPVEQPAPVVTAAPVAGAPATRTSSSLPPAKLG
ncbi:MAG TPA: hypothetical protein VL400_17010, partial [Polyangiaceae bacterium]|nr:hypothetical protein [Polyangiaceae bacterium]